MTRCISLIPGFHWMASKATGACRDYSNMPGADQLLHPPPSCVPCISLKGKLLFCYQEHQLTHHTGRPQDIQTHEQDEYAPTPSRVSREIKHWATSSMHSSAYDLDSRSMSSLQPFGGDHAHALSMDSASMPSDSELPTRSELGHMSSTAYQESTCHRIFFEAMLIGDISRQGYNERLWRRHHSW